MPPPVEGLVDAHVLHAGLFGDGLDDLTHRRPVQRERDPRLQDRLAECLVLLCVRGEPGAGDRQKSAADCHCPHGRSPSRQSLRPAPHLPPRTMREW